MPIQLTKTQRIVLIVAAGIILLVQLAGIAENGLEENRGWFWAILVSAALLVIAFAKSPESEKPGKGPLQNSTFDVKGVETFINMVGKHKQVSQYLDETEEVADRLHRHLQEWVPLIPNSMNGLLINGWKQHCMAYSFALVCCAEYKSDPNFFERDIFKSFLANTANRMATLIEELSKEMKFSGTFDRQKVRLSAGKDLIEARNALKEFIEKIASREPKPDTPLIQFLVTKIGVSGGPLPVFARKLQEFTQETLLELTTVRKG